MSDLPMKQEDHPAYNMKNPVENYQEYQHPLPKYGESQASANVNRTNKGDSEKKDQSRYVTPQWRSIDSNGVESD